MYEFEIRTGKIAIDHNKCEDCTSFACVKACSAFGRQILRLENLKPILSTTPEDAKRICNECLCCELYCKFDGRDAVKISLPMPELLEYRRKIGLE